MCVGIAVVIGSAVEAGAGPRRARLSRDLQERLARNAGETSGVIVRGTAAQIAALAERHGLRVGKRLRGSAVLEVNATQLDALSQDPDVPQLSGDVRIHRMMAVTTEAVGADQLWAGAFGRARRYTGRGVTVAVIDSGVDRTHPDLRSRVIVERDFTGARSGRADDEYGHGTHVAGTIAGGGSDGYAGVAPGASIANLRAIGSDGSGLTSDVIEALEWAVDHRHRYNIRVVNLSLGHPVLESYRDDPLGQAVQAALDAGILVVAAAGNFGQTADGVPVVGGIVSPGNVPGVLTVGAVTTNDTAARSDDVMAAFSSRGPTSIDGVLKPELVAPGWRITAAGARASYLVRTYPERVTEMGARAYLRLSGTSMSAAVVSGSAALLLEAAPRLRPAQVKMLLQVSSSRVEGAGLIEAGAGSVNVLAAVGVAMGAGGDGRVFLIAREPFAAQRLAFEHHPADDSAEPPPSEVRTFRRPRERTSIGAVLGLSGRARSNTIVWADTVVWADRPLTARTVVWADSLLHGEMWHVAIRSFGLITWPRPTPSLARPEAGLL